MSAEALITNLTKLYGLHEKLLNLAIRKTDLLTKGNVDGLQDIMREEQTLTAAVTVLENERQTAAKNFVKAESGEGLTLADCIKAATPEAAETLSALRDKMLEIVTQLQERNELNEQLIYQSLQFVNMNLELLQPKNETGYGRPNAKKPAQPSKSFFDSKA